MSPKLGQKIKDNPKDKRIEIRMDDETVRKLDILANEQNVSRAKVIRQGIEIQYKNRQK
jgi:predicted transcriptional regulator